MTNQLKRVNSGVTAFPFPAKPLDFILQRHQEIGNNFFLQRKVSTPCSNV
jgi:hypothetical protein